MSDRTITDSRGVTHEVAPTLWNFGSTKSLSPAVIEPYGMRMARAGCSMMLLGAGGFVLFLIMMRLLAEVLPDTGPQIAGLAAVAILVFAMYRTLGRAHHLEAVDQLADPSQSVRLCACCRYDLDALPVEADGCTVCPECGAAWRLAG